MPLNFIWSMGDNSVWLKGGNWTKRKRPIRILDTKFKPFINNHNGKSWSAIISCSWLLILRDLPIFNQDENMDVEKLQQMKYQELQKLAKKHGIKANMKVWYYKNLYRFFYFTHSKNNNFLSQLLKFAVET